MAATKSFKEEHPLGKSVDMSRRWSFVFCVVHHRVVNFLPDVLEKNNLELKRKFHNYNMCE